MDNLEYKKLFFEYLKEEFSPTLRELGFKGSGKNFRRINGHVIHAINIQSNRYGDSCCLNLGLHLDFIPLFHTNELPNIKTIKEVECEFRKRVVTNSGDCWYRYKANFFTSPEKSAKKLINTYLEFGEPEFQSVTTVEEIIKLFSSSSFSNETVTLFGDSTQARAGLNIARIYKFLNNVEECKRYASLGLKYMGNGILIKDELEELAGVT